jgi:hypothetical protein
MAGSGLLVRVQSPFDKWRDAVADRSGKKAAEAVFSRESSDWVGKIMVGPLLAGN